jgi:putative aldouronate transport system permease protein
MGFGENRYINKTNRTLKQIIKHWQLYLVILLPVAYIIIFYYVPMYGLQIAFRDYMPAEGFLGSPWVGLKHFKAFVSSYNFWKILGNTLGISIYTLIAGFPMPIILALFLNEMGNQKLKRTIQTITYAPHFITTVVMVSIIIQFLSPRVGVINNFIELLGGERTNFMAVSQYFKSIYVWSGIWQSTGYSSIIYLAALASVDQALHEAATIDGATRFQRMWYIDIPGIMPTAVILLILNMGGIMNVGFEKIFAMQNSLNFNTSEVISTYVYKLGIQRANFSYATAVGLFNSVINLILLLTVNQIAKKTSETSLW